MDHLLVAATALEITPFLKQYQQLGNSRLDILITGVGLTASTYALSRQIAIKRPGFIWQAGIAGSFDPGIKLGAVLGIRKDAIADEGVREKNSFRTVFDLGLGDPDRYPFKKGGLVNPGHSIIKTAALPMVNAVSVNEVSTDNDTIRYYRKKYRAVTESMEGAALHYVCLMEKIPFLQIRAVSNYAGERNKKEWKIKEAIASLNGELIRLLKNY